MQKANYLFEICKIAPHSHMQIDDEFSLDFMVRSEIKEDVWYNVNMSPKTCDCDDRAYICKHMIFVKKIVEE